jgi:hypothetical protein
VINQETFPHIISEAKERMLRYYNKMVSQENLNFLETATLVKYINIPERPRSPNLFYVTILAEKFDLIPSLDNFVMTPITKESSLYNLADEYRDFFRTTDNTDIGKRARITEILQANGIDVFEATNSDIEQWIYTVNYGAETPPGKSVKFNAGSQIYLPRTEPDFSRVISGGTEVELEISELEANIQKLISALRKYGDQIRDSQFVARAYDSEKQINELRNFIPRIKKHFTDNDYQFRNFFEDRIRIGLDSELKLVYVGLVSGGNVAYMNKAIPGLSSIAPFNDIRTMNFILNLGELSLLNIESLGWKEFLEQYVRPKVEVSARDVTSVLEESTQGILEQLASRFDKTSAKSDRQLGEENSIYGSVQILNGIFNQLENQARDVGDTALQNLADISAKLANPGETAIGISSTVFNEVLNKIDFKSLAASAIDCLKEQVPFDCEDVILAVSEGSLELVASAFRQRISEQNRDIVDEALQVATTSDFTLYQVKYESQIYKPLEESLSGASEGQIFLGALEIGLNNAGEDYNSVFQEVCSYFSNPKNALTDAFFLPTILLPAELPTVDIDQASTQAFERALIDIISSLILSAVQAIISTILNRCRDIAQSSPEGAPDYGSGPDLSEAIANSVGLPNFASSIENIFDSLSLAVSPEIETTDGEFILVGTGSIDLGTDITIETQPGQPGTIEQKLFLMQSLFQALKLELTSPEIIRLLEGNASEYLYRVVLGIINSDEHNELKPLREIIYTPGHVSDLFSEISNLTDIGPTIEQVQIISSQLGCSLDDFVSSRVPLWCNKIPKKEVKPVAEQTVIDEQDNLSQYYTYIWKPGDIFIPPCDDPDVGTKALIPKDTNSFNFMIDKVLKTVFDSTYMSYDSAVLSFPDPMFVEFQIGFCQLVPRSQLIILTTPNFRKKNLALRYQANSVKDT